MARKVRIQYPGAIYHAMNRGDHQETIFCNDDDHKLFLSTLAECCQKTAWRWEREVTSRICSISMPGLPLSRRRPTNLL